MPRLNQCYIDQQQQAVIKIFSDPNKLEREIAGLQTFSQFCLVPTATQLDSKTVRYPLVSGTRADQIPPQTLSLLVIKLLSSIPSQSSPTHLSILSQIEAFCDIFTDRPQIITFLLRLGKSLASRKLFPVHGDLQKQNIFLCDQNRIALIDFEHFTFAPLELELVNSVFFSDANCLDVANILPALKLSPPLLSQMLVYYSIKQLALGHPEIFVQASLNTGLKKIARLTNVNLSRFSPPSFSKKTQPTSTNYSCFA